MVTVHPQALTVIDVRRGVTPRLAPRHVQPITSHDGDPPWRAPLDALADWLNGHDIQAARLHLTVADRLMHYAWIEWPPARVDETERTAWAMLQAEAQLGPAVHNWTWRFDWPGFGEPGIGCALDPDFDEALRAVCARHRVRVARITPAFVVACNRSRRHIPDTALLANVDGEHGVLATRRAGCWQGLRTVLLADGETWPAVMERELVLQGLPPGMPILMLDQGAATDGEAAVAPAPSELAADR
jgi:hypothetical protein